MPPTPDHPHYDDPEHDRPMPGLGEPTPGTRPGTPQPEPETEHALPLSVWPTGQRPAASQRRGRYLPGSTAHPAKMLPAVAATAITSYTRPGELVLDPMCGIGTTLVEAVHHDRAAIGIEVEPRWATLARNNLTHARAQGAPGSAGVITGDARYAGSLITDPAIAGNAALLLTSPPYGHSTHGQVAPSSDTGQPKLRKWDHHYGKNPNNLIRGNHDRLLTGFTDILNACLPLLRPGGILAITTRPFRRHGTLVDFPGQVWAAAQTAGYQPLQRIVALLCGIKGNRLITRASFFAMHETRKARTTGLPLHVTAHEDVLILHRPLKAPSSDELKAPQREPNGPSSSSSPVDPRVRGSEGSDS